MPYAHVHHCLPIYDYRPYSCFCPTSGCSHLVTGEAAIQCRADDLGENGTVDKLHDQHKPYVMCIPLQPSDGKLWGR